MFHFVLMNKSELFPSALTCAGSHDFMAALLLQMVCRRYGAHNVTPHSADKTAFCTQCADSPVHTMSHRTVCRLPSAHNVTPDSVPTPQCTQCHTAQCANTTVHTMSYRTVCRRYNAHSVTLHSAKKTALTS